jgi:TRAP-type C4-dicarboxylate transport system permease small subunit
MLSTRIGQLARIWAIAGGLATLAIVLVTTTNVGLFALNRLARMFGGDVAGLPGYEDFVSLAVGAAAIMFFPLCEWRRGHIAVDVFTEKLPQRFQNGLDRTWSAVTCLLALFLAYWMTIGMLESRDDHALSPVLGWPIWPFYLPGIISLIIWAAVASLQAAGKVSRGAS